MVHGAFTATGRRLYYLLLFLIFSEIILCYGFWETTLTLFTPTAAGAPASPPSHVKYFLMFLIVLALCTAITHCILLNYPEAVIEDCQKRVCDLLHVVAPDSLTAANVAADRAMPAPTSYVPRENGWGDLFKFNFAAAIGLAVLLGFTLWKNTDRTKITKVLKVLGGVLIPIGIVVYLGLRIGYQNEITRPCYLATCKAPSNNCHSAKIMCCPTNKVLHSQRLDQEIPDACQAIDHCDVTTEEACEKFKNTTWLGTTKT